MAAMSAASAAPVTLTCHILNEPGVIENEAHLTTVTVDDVAQSFQYTGPWMKMQGGMGDWMKGDSFGPQPAEFTSDTIKTYDPRTQNTYTLNRNTGIMALTNSSGERDLQCQVVQRQF